MLAPDSQNFGLKHSNKNFLHLFLFREVSHSNKSHKTAGSDQDFAASLPVETPDIGTSERCGTMWSVFCHVVRRSFFATSSDALVSNSKHCYY